MIELKNITKAYERVTPLNNVSTVINDGDVIAVIGPSGCGKSTLLRMINLLERPTSGKIFVDGTDITAPGYKEYEIGRKIGMVFQSFNLFGHLTALENIMIPQMDLLGKSKQEAYDRAMQLLHSVGMDSRALQYPHMLSGGQKQRVAIARTLALDPEVILFDEPTSALDPTMVGEVQTVIRELAKTGITMMIVTHEMKFAREISSRVFFMEEGGIYEDGTPEQIFENPQKTLTRRFIRGLKVFDTVIDKKNYDFIGVMTDIEQYGQKIRIEKKAVYVLQSIFEELCQQILLKHNPDYKIRFAVEYSEKDDKLKVIVSYNGDLFDPENTDNVISLSILKSRITTLKYAQSPDSAFRNMVFIDI